jgi:hypothetical protein
MNDNLYGEICYSGDTIKQTLSISNPLVEETIAKVKSLFPWFRQEDYFSMSLPAQHEVLDEPVVTCCLPSQATEAITGNQLFALSARKFCLNSKTSFFRVYRVFDGQKPDFLPQSAKALFVGENHEEFQRPFNPKVQSFYDLYFSGNPEDVEAFFGLPVNRGKYETYYGVTVVDGKVGRVKQYTFDDQGGFSDWDVIWMAHAKRLGALPSN